jgi:hypothetical protein
MKHGRKVIGLGVQQAAKSSYNVGVREIKLIKLN